MSKYTSPFFGDRNLGAYTPPSIDFNKLQYINRASARKLNNAGQVVEADLAICRSSNSFTRSGMQVEMYLYQARVKSEASKIPIAILAMPMTYGNHANTKQSGYYSNFAGAVLSYNDINCFNYFICVKSAEPLLYYHDNRAVNNDIVAGYYHIQSMQIAGEVPPYPQLVTNFGNRSDSQSYLTRSNIFDRDNQNIKLKDLVTQLNIFNGQSPQGVRYNSVSNDILLYQEGKVAALQTYLSHWADMTDSVLNSVYVGGYLGINPMFVSGVSNKVIGSWISTGFPVFTLDNFEQLVAYFQGDYWIADNDAPPPADWSTDWDIYIKGAQKPDIFITMKSDKVDDWLNNLDENRGGAVKEDIAVEYRYRQYEITNLDSQSIWNLYEYSLKNLEKDSYNNQKDTDYVSNCNLNFPDFDLYIGTNEFAEGTVQNAYPYYAELEFRIKYGDYRSSWCYYKIGVIGSPSVPDFTLMNNEGALVMEQEDFDSSTVTLHYDEYPPDYNPWPIPPNPPMPPIGPTDPSAGVNGSGLLTTIYRLTEQQAKALGRFLWSGDIFQKIKALNTSPISNIVGLYYMPIFISGIESIINIGDVDTNINADEISGSTPLYELGSVEYKGRYQNFVDYEPYTNAHIFLPFVGFVRLNPVYFTNKTLKVVYAYDLVCGLCNAMLFADNVYVESHQGNCGIEIPLEASNRAQVAIGLASGLFHTALSLATTEGLSAITAVAAGTSVFDSIMSAADSFSSQRQGNYSPATAWCETRQCFLVIESPDASYTATFNHDFGRPCMASHNISQLSGFTVVDANVDLKGFDGATQEEINMIKDLLSTGFYA